MKTFSIKLTRNPQEVVAKFKAAAEKNNFRFNGDDHRGVFNGMGIEGRYDIEGDILAVTIEKKPMLLGWSMIEGKVRQFIA